MMDFKDWRTSSPESSPQEEQSITGRRYQRGRRFADYIEEQIREAEERGVFRDLPGQGKPLKLDTNPYAGEKAPGYSLLKSQGYLPAEIELAREIDRELARLAQQHAVLIQRGRELRRRRIPPFASEKRAYNHAVNKTLAEYETSLRELNSKILTLNLTAPAPMHRVPLKIEQMLHEFRELCPLFV